MPRKQYVVNNKSKSIVCRGGKRFLPGKQEVFLRDYQFREARAHVDLSVIPIPEKLLSPWDLLNEERETETGGEAVKSFPCPAAGCNFVAKSRIGLQSHMRKHK